MKSLIFLSIKILRTFFFIPIIFFSLLNKSIKRTFSDFQEITNYQLQETIVPIKSLLFQIFIKIKSSIM